MLFDCLAYYYHHCSVCYTSFSWNTVQQQFTITAVNLWQFVLVTVTHILTRGAQTRAHHRVHAEGCRAFSLIYIYRMRFI